MGQDSDLKTKVFLSYSRIDEAFCVRLADALHALGYAAIYDRSKAPSGDDPDTRLTAQDEWWAQLKTMIAASDVMVFVVTPASASSRVCDEEIEHARNLGKRIIAILRSSIDFNSAPERLRALNVKIDFSDNETFDSALAQLRQELDLDIEWHRRGGHYMRLAQRWETDGRPEGQLLRAGAIAEADAWATRRPRDAPSAGPLLLAFLDKSREKERADSDDRRRTLGRTFLKPARQAFEEGFYDGALRLTAAGALLSEDLMMTLVAERTNEGQWHRAAFENRVRRILRGHEYGVISSAVSPDGRLVATGGQDYKVRIWDAITGAAVATLADHGGKVYVCAFNSDGTRLLTAGGDTAFLWDVARASELARFKGHEGFAYSGEFSPDGEHALIAGWDDGSLLWRVRDGQEVVRMPAGMHCCFSPNGRYAIVDGPNCLLHVFDVRSRRQVREIKGDKSFGSIVCSPDSRVVAATLSNEVRGYDIETGRELFRASSDGQAAIDALCFSPDGSRILFGSNDKSARVLDARTGAELLRCEHQAWVKFVVFSPDGDRFATAVHSVNRSLAADDAIHVWDTRTGQEILALRGHDEDITCLAWGKDPTTLISGAADGAVRIWDTSVGPEMARYWEPSADDVVEVALSPDARSVLTAHDNCTARLWDRETGAKLATVASSANRVAGSVFSPDGAFIATTCVGDAVQVFSRTKGEVIARLERDQSWLQRSLFSSDGAHLVIEAKDGVTTYDAKKWQRRSRIAPSGDIQHTRVSPSVPHVAVVWRDKESSENRAAVFDMVTGREIYALDEDGERVYGVEFSPDGAMLLAAGSSGIRVWDTAARSQIDNVLRYERSMDIAKFDSAMKKIVGVSGAEGAVWEFPSGSRKSRFSGHNRTITSVAFSEDGGRILTASEDGTARVWDVTTGAELARLRHEGHVYSAAFVPGTHQVLSGSRDGTARIWDVSRSEALAGPGAVVLAASLSDGRGVRTGKESEDLLMQNAPDDLYAAVVADFSESERANVEARAKMLSRPFHPNCYLPRSRRPGFPGDMRASEAPVVERHEFKTAPRPPAARAARQGAQRLSLGASSLIALVGVTVGAGSVFLLHAWLK